MINDLRPVKSAFAVIVAGMFAANLNAQSPVYAYDASGNRVKRSVAAPAKSRAADTAHYSPAADSAALENIAGTDGFPAPETDGKNGALEVRAYPNPTSGILEVEIANLKDSGKAQLEIYTFAGRLIKRAGKLQSRQTVDLSNCASGIYLLRITAGGETAERKIIKE